MTRRLVWVVWAAVALALWGSPAWPQLARGGAWASAHFPRALEDFLPIQFAEGAFIAVRVYRSHENDLREYSIVFEDAQDTQKLRAIVREARGSSLFDQLAALHAAHPSASYDQLKSALQVRVWALAPGRCPAVVTQFRAFEKVQFVHPADDQEPGPNPVLYQFNESLAGGGSVLEYMPNRALPRWARATRRALDACIASGNATAP